MFGTPAKKVGVWLGKCDDTHSEGELDTPDKCGWWNIKRIPRYHLREGDYIKIVTHD